MTMHDRTGREIKAGDLLKVPHFVEARHRRRIYMYKLVVNVGDDHRISNYGYGQSLYAVDAIDIFKCGSLEQASRCPLSVIGDCEIIDGGTVDGDDLWWERSMLTREIESKAGGE